MSARLCLVLSSAVLATSVVAAGPGWAQDQSEKRTTTVTDRSHPELDPLGVRMGAFFLYPSLGVGEVYNDNIFATQNNEESDYVTVVSPAVRLKSNWSRHSLEAGLRADIGRYADNTNEDYEDFNAFTNGQVDISRRSRVSGGLSYGKLHEDRSSPDDVNGITPTEYSILGGNLAFRQELNRLNATLTGDYRQFDYDDVGAGGGVIINNDDRDHDERVIGLRLGYEIVPEYEAFVRTTYNQREYDSATDDSGLNRDSEGYEAVAGVRLDLSGKTFGDVFVGYRNQDYDDPALSSISGLSFGAALTWNVTELTTAKLDVTRRVEETTQIGSSGVMASWYGVTVDHELLRNLLIGGGAAYGQEDYEGTGREDDLTQFNLYAKYLWNRYLDLTLGYNRQSRDSNQAGSDYEQNRLMLKIEASL